MKQLIVWFLSVIYVSPVALGDVPRTPAGQPDLTGNYDSGSLHLRSVPEFLVRTNS